MAAAMQVSWKNAGLVIERLRNLGSTLDAVARRVYLRKTPNAIKRSSSLPSWWPSLKKMLKKDCKHYRTVLRWSGMTDTEYNVPYEKVQVQLMFTFIMWPLDFNWYCGFSI